MLRSQLGALIMLVFSTVPTAGQKSPIPSVMMSPVEASMPTGRLKLEHRTTIILLLNKTPHALNEYVIRAHLMFRFFDLISVMYIYIVKNV